MEEGNDDVKSTGSLFALVPARRGAERNAAEQNVGAGSKAGVVLLVCVVGIYGAERGEGGGGRR